jgi:hypothetical protein
MRYNLKYLEELQHVPNVGMIIEQIDNAATISSEEMRRYGISLPSAVPQGPAPEGRNVRPPMKAEIDTYLRFLVADAYIGFMEARTQADQEKQEVPDSEIEGLLPYVDPMFEVSITGLEGGPKGFLTARIARRLTW